MSLISKGRLTVKRFAAVSTLLNGPAIQRPPASVSGISSFRGHDGGVDLREGCLVTRTVKYTHQLVHWINAVPNGDSSDVEDLIEDLCIVQYEGFRLDHPCNLSFLNSDLHTSLDLYAFIAVTASASTLADLIAMVRSDNDRRQQEVDQMGLLGAVPRRMLNFSNASFLNPEYELVVLHPDNLLPDGDDLSIYDRTTKTHKRYVVASDQCLRESPDPNSSRLPGFSHTFECRDHVRHLNVFLVVLNADIKFRRYFDMVVFNPPATPLPNDVLALMNRTMELADLLYWKPVLSEGSLGAVTMGRAVVSRRNYGRVARPNPTTTVERGSSEEKETMADEVIQRPSVSTRRRRMRWLAGEDLSSRQAYGRAIMSGHDHDYDPALFEDAFPVNYMHPYSEKDVEAWTQVITPEHLDED